MFQVDETLETKHAVFQFILHYVNPNNSSDLITRVVSQRLKVVNEDHGSQFFHSLQKDTLSVLLAKEAAYRCMVDNIGDENEHLVYGHEEIEDLVLQTQEDLDTTAHRIIHSCNQLR